MKQTQRGEPVSEVSGISYSSRTEDNAPVVKCEVQDNVLIYTGEIMVHTKDYGERAFKRFSICNFNDDHLPKFFKESEISESNNDSQIILDYGTATIDWANMSVEIVGSEEMPVQVRVESIPDDGDRTAFHIVCHESVTWRPMQEVSEQSETANPDLSTDNGLPPEATTPPEAPDAVAPEQGSVEPNPGEEAHSENTEAAENAGVEDENAGVEDENAGVEDEDAQPETTAEPIEPTQDTAEKLNIIQSNESLWIQNPVSFHAVDAEKGWHVEENVKSVQIKSPEQKHVENIAPDQVITIRGGVCTKQSQEGSAELLIEDGRDDPLIIELTERNETHAGREGLCVDYTGTLGPVAEASGSIHPGIYVGSLLMAVILGACLSRLFFIRRKKQKYSVKPESVLDTDSSSVPAIMEDTGSTEMFSKPLGALTISCGTCQDIGKRSSQQDSFLLRKINGGVIGVVADGMGGLKDGDLVSRKIVNTIDEACSTFSAEQLRGNLMAVVTRVNDEVNRMLGPNELYKCGSTIVAALAEPHQFQWISVGDSRIYLYRTGLLLQLNREHNFEADLLLRAVNHQLSFQEAKGNPKRRSVSSFIGMGTLKYVDEAQRPTRSMRGDRILICSDGVFNTLPEQEIERILGEYPEPNSAAERLKAAVLQANNPHQDNFTAVIIAYE